MIGIAFQALAVKEAKFEKGLWCVGISLILHVVQLCIGSQTEHIGLLSMAIVQIVFLCILNRMKKEIDK
ncbi:MAG: hypothetical protein RR448_05450 [Niameybacter sp.]|uniref:hypothetical protein n=1 Tax=Niameybacter sp. TaxID=2033640 RepID=UPI002FC5E191